MRIAMMVRGYLPVPRPADMIYAPIDLAQAVAENLARKGHEIDFYAPLGSGVEGVKIVSLNLRALATGSEEFQELLADIDKSSHYYTALWEDRFATEMFERAKRGEYDVLHFHHPEVAMPLARKYKKVPVVYTLHDPVVNWLKESYELFASPNQHFVSISDNQRRDGPDLPYIKTVHNGINPKDFPFSAKQDDYLLYAGRIVPEKGVREAVQVARQTKKRLLIIGPVYPTSQGYFDQYVKPFLNERILYLGYLERNQLAGYYQKAAAVLTPVQWEEPFGLTTIEAMASGTPVISFNRGAAPELIINGKTGYIVNNTSEMVGAVRKIGQIKRSDCRDHVARRFSAVRMANGYLDAYEAVAKRGILTTARLVSRRFRLSQTSLIP